MCLQNISHLCVSVHSTGAAAPQITEPKLPPSLNCMSVEEIARERIVKTLSGFLNY